MSTVKGLLKGLRYISQIFENEKEEEFVIGLPTDVKHVAHIGNDGPSANSPSWINEFQSSSSETTSVLPPVSDVKAVDNHTSKSSAKVKPFRGNIEIPPRPTDAPFDSPTRRAGKTKQSRRHARNSSTGSEGYVDSEGSPARDPSSNLKPRRHKNSNLESPRRRNNTGVRPESSSQDPNMVPKPSRRKKSKGGSTDGSRKSRTKDVADPQSQKFPYSDPGPGPAYELDNNSEICQKSILEKYEDEKECEEITRGVRAL